MLAAATLDSKISETFDWNRQLKCCTAHTAGHYSSLLNCGCSSVVEHLLAKEDVASSSLVTRCFSRLSAALRDHLVDRAHLLHHLLVFIERERLRSVGKRFIGSRVHFHHDAIRSDSDTSARERRHHITSTTIW